MTTKNDMVKLLGEYEHNKKCFEDTIRLLKSAAKKKDASGFVYEFESAVVNTQIGIMSVKEMNTVFETATELKKVFKGKKQEIVDCLFE